MFSRSLLACVCALILLSLGCAARTVPSATPRASQDNQPLELSYEDEEQFAREFGDE